MNILELLKALLVEAGYDVAESSTGVIWARRNKKWVGEIVVNGPQLTIYIPGPTNNAVYKDSMDMADPSFNPSGLLAILSRAHDNQQARF